MFGPRISIIVSVYVIWQVTSILSSTTKLLLVRATYERQSHKFEYQMQFARIYSNTWWLWTIPLEKWDLFHNGKRHYGLMTTNFSEVFNSFLKGAKKCSYHGPVYR